MSLPITIEPNPVLTATVEIRVKTSLRSDDILGIFSQLLLTKFPKVREGGVPRNLKDKNPQLRNTPDYVFSNDNYSIGVSNTIILFNNNSKYVGWEDYFYLIKETLSLLSKENFILAIERVGVRYLNLFDTIEGMNKILSLDVNINFPEYKSSNRLYRSDLYIGDVKILFQVSDVAEVVMNDGNRVKGVYLDIDSSLNQKLPNNVDETLISIIENLHNESKKLFFKLLKPDYLNTLNPKY